ncbi:hypothetical protein C789_2404 [Microcystis aeruginosa FACHB-905 = DIANCHI905]|nr:hypothetical protein C789_2404 [Microcystis aeruginosa FACHB-905 = DIANCHI905]
MEAKLMVFQLRLLVGSEIAITRFTSSFYSMTVLLQKD